MANSNELDALAIEVQTEVQEALRFAMQSPFPNAEDAFSDLYSEPIPLSH